MIINGCTKPNRINLENIENNNVNENISLSLIEQQIHSLTILSQKKIVTIYTQKKTETKDSIFEKEELPYNGYLLQSDNYIVSTIPNSISNSIFYVKTYNNKIYKTQLIGRDYETQLAILKIIENDIILPYLKIENNENIHIGDIAIALNNPYNIGLTSTFNIISSIKTQDFIKIIDNSEIYYLLDNYKAFNYSSGGYPIINIYGNIIGISLIRNERNLNKSTQYINNNKVLYFLSADDLKNIIAKIINN